METSITLKSKIVGISLFVILIIGIVASSYNFITLLIQAFKNI